MKKVLAPETIAHWVDDWHLAPALDTGDFVFFSGVTGASPDLTVSDDPETQFRDTFGFLGDCLVAAGLGFDDIVDITTYHVDLRRHLETFVRVKDAFIKPPYPAWSAIGVTELITEGTLVEIRAIARRG